MADPTQQSWPAGTRRLGVQDVQFDLRFRRVIRPDQEAELPQRMFDLLLVFLAEPHVLHNRADLFARVWPGVIVEDSNLSQSIWMLRKALGESRKHWIRTVAKSGYVFEPPGQIEVMDGPTAAAIAEPDADAGAAMPEPAPAGAAAPRTASASRRRTAWVVGTLAVIALAAAGLFGWLRSRTPEPAPSAPDRQLAIALIEVKDPAASQDARWPAALLHAWLGWKLDSLPEVTLLTEAHLAADSEGSSPRIVFLSSGADSAQPGRMVLRARFEADGGERRLEKVGTAAQLPQLADALSQELLAALVPGRARERWPALEIDAAAAQRYAEGLQALERRDWVQSVDLLQDVTRMAPRFGLPRMQLGYALTKLSRATPAIEQTEAALRLLRPVPADVAAALEAERLSRDPQQWEDAAEAWGRLARKYPGKRLYTLEQASKLNGANLPKEALALLDRPDWDRQSAGIRLRQRLNLAAAYLSLGDPARGRENAQIAERIAAAAGKGWERERGDALLLVAQADTFQYEDKADLSRYEAAARQFEVAGDEMSALYARFLAESSRRDQPPESGLDALMVQARERGYRRLEIEMLRMVAFRHYERGDVPAYRARLEQALATALTSGDTFEQRMIELDLLNEDVLRGLFDSAERRIASLDKAGLQGDSANWMSSYEALILANRGRLPAAEQVLDRAAQRDREANPGTGPSTASARIACVRADLRLARGDVPGARNQWKECTAIQSPSSDLQALIGNAAIDLAVGDPEGARKRLQAAARDVARLPDGPDRWAIELWIATVATRAGETATAERMYQRVLPMARATQYEWIIAIAETGLAETAAARGDWAAVREHAAAARRPDLADIWTLRGRLDVLEVATAIHERDPARALRVLAAAHAQAVRNDDVVAQMEMLSLVPPGMSLGECGERCRAALAMRTGLRGATLDWLTRPAKIDTGVLAGDGAR